MILYACVCSFKACTVLWRVNELMKGLINLFGWKVIWKKNFSVTGRI